MHQKLESLDDVSDVSDSVDVQHDSEDRDASQINWDTDTSEVQPSTEPSSSGLPSVQNGMSDKKSQSLMDDSSSTCSTDSVPSVNLNVPVRGNLSPNIKNQKSPSRLCFSMVLIGSMHDKLRGMVLISASNFQGKEPRQGNLS